jgi:hypothetical protein
MINKSEMSIIEAVDVLGSISDLDLEEDVGILLLHDKETGRMTFKTIEPATLRDKVAGLHGVETAFKQSLKTVQSFYKQEFGGGKWAELEEKVKSVMVLVGDSAKKLDAYGELIEKEAHKSLLACKEYQNLQEFTRKNLSRAVTEGVLGKWILEVAKGAWSVRGTHAPTQKINRIFVDLESVKNDSEYELFYLRKEDGGRFFSPELIRNIKLVSDFGDFLEKAKPGDLLTDIDIWQDRMLQQTAKQIIRYAEPELSLLFKEVHRHKDHDLVADLCKAAIALFAASNPRNLKKDVSTKACRDYFGDFLHFYRAALTSIAYQKLVAYPSKKSHVIGAAILKVSRGLAQGLFRHRGYIETAKPLVHQLIEEGGKEISIEHQREADCLWSRLAYAGKAVDKVMKTHPSGPLNKVIKAIVKGQYRHLEPLNKDNPPAYFYTLCWGDNATEVLRIPSPTSQESIASAEIIPEYQAFLDFPEEKHLMFIVQDRTTWKECARTRALEALENLNHAVTLPMDTDFYNQSSLYFEEDGAQVFLDQLLDMAGDLNAGYYFKADEWEKIEPLVPKMINTIHSLFFQNKPTLSRTERMVFIDIFYLFIALKAIAQVNPKTISFTCKDGLDTGNLFAVWLQTFYLLMADSPVDEAVIAGLQAEIFAPALLNRERSVLKNRFTRFIQAVKHVESVKAKIGAKNYSHLVKEALRLLIGDAIADGWISESESNG